MLISPATGSARALSAIAIVGALIALAAPVAHADRLADVSRVLEQSQKEKSRISAAIALGRLGDERAVAPLSRALEGDQSKLVRAVSAAALGHLGDQRALPALERATRDADAAVRKRAREAIAQLRQPSADAAVRDDLARPAPAPSRARVATTPRESPRGVTSPSFHVALQTVADQTPDQAAAALRKWRTDSVRQFILAEMRNTPEITLDAGRARELGIRSFQIDVVIVSLERRTRGRFLEIECKVRLAVSNGRGRMLSFLTGGATLQVPARRRDDASEDRLGREAMENAARNMHQDLVSYLGRERRL